MTTYTHGTTRFEIELGSEVTLPDNNDKVEAIYCVALGKMLVRKKSQCNNKLKHCSDANALVAAFMQLTETDNDVSVSNTAPHYSGTANDVKDTSTNVSESNTDPHNSVSTSDKPKVTKAKSDPHNSETAAQTTSNYSSNIVDLTQPNIIDIEGELVDTNTGEIVGKCKRADSLTRAWRNQQDKIYNSMPWDKSCFVSPTVDNNATYDNLSTLSANYASWIMDTYPDAFGSIFCEPRSDGSWHSHIIPCFPNGVPDDFEDETKAWWAQYNNKECDEQVLIVRFENEEHFHNTINYLKPTRTAKKRKNVKYYRVGSQPIRSFGKVTKPTKVLTTFAVVQEVTGDEKKRWRKQVKVFDVLTETLLYSAADYYFNVKPNLFVPMTKDINSTSNDNAEDANTTADSGTADVEDDAQTNTTSNGGKRDYFHCADEESGKCVCHSDCDRHGKCEYCFGYSTSFCRGCIWDD